MVTANQASTSRTISQAMFHLRWLGPASTQGSSEQSVGHRVSLVKPSTCVSNNAARLMAGDLQHQVSTFTAQTMTKQLWRPAGPQTSTRSQQPPDSVHLSWLAALHDDVTV